MAERHKSDSGVQREAEGVILAALNEQHGWNLTKHGTRLDLNEKMWVEVDAVDRENKLMVEVFARQGALKPGQRKKICQDLLKFSLLQALDEYAVWKRYIVFADDEARSSFNGWPGLAAERLGVEFLIADIDPELRASIRQAQQQQVMVNIGDTADDVDVVDET